MNRNWINSAFFALKRESITDMATVRVSSNWKAILMAIAIKWPVLLWADQVVTQPFCGITLITRTETSPRNLIMHIAQIDLREPGISFKLTGPGGTRDSVRQTTLDFLNKEHAQLAVNAHFYLPFTTPDTNANLIGLAASEGIVYSPFEPQPIGPDYTDQSFAIVSYAPGLNIDRTNRVTIVHRDPTYADNRHVSEQVALWTVVSGSAQIVTDALKSIPTYSGPPGGLNASNSYSATNSWYNVLRARTVIGVTRDNVTLVLFTVDEVNGSAGMTVGETADLLIRDYQVYNALNLDGDGSTAMAVEDPITHVGRLVNSSSDNALGRGVGSSLAVFAGRVSDGAVRLTITQTATNRVVLSWPRGGSTWDLQRTPTLNPERWQSVGAETSQIGDCAQVILPVGDEDSFYRIVQMGTLTNNTISPTTKSLPKDKAVKSRRIRTDQK